MAERVAGEGDLEKVIIKSEKGGRAEVYLHGAHITSWKTPSGDEVLFTSKEAIFKPPKAIRGGVPVCFPQFADMGPIGQHGFARNSLFEVESSTEESVVLVLRPSEEQLSSYPHPFELRIDISLLPGTLSQKMTVKNTGDGPMEFTCALHTYFGIGDITQASVTGLGGTEYLDSVDKRIQKPWENDAVTFEEEVDRVYIKTKGTLKIVDGANNRTVLHTKSGFPDAVVWNPWIDKAKATGDFGDEEYKTMLCVEPAIAASGPITVPAGQSWCGSQVLVVE